MKSLGTFPDPFIGEIAGQSDAMRRAAASAHEQAAQIDDVLSGPRRSIVFCGMGSSYHACYPATTVLAERGVTAWMVGAAELVHFRTAMFDANDLLVLVSQSGRSAEIVRAASMLRERRSPPRILAIANGLANPLAELADATIDTAAGEETGPSTMTFAASLVVLAAIALRAIGDRAEAVAMREDVEEAARAVDLLVEDKGLAERLVAWHGDRSSTVILGRGGARAAAEMSALTLKEAVGMPVEALEAAQFRHGPLELAGADLAALVLITEPAVSDLDRRLARELRDLGSSVLVAATDSHTAGDGDGVDTIAIGPLSRLLAPAVVTVPAQLLARTLALARGRTPGGYLHAAKVTTRE